MCERISYHMKYLVSLCVIAVRNKAYECIKQKACVDKKKKKIDKYNNFLFDIFVPLTCMSAFFRPFTSHFVILILFKILIYTKKKKMNKKKFPFKFLIEIHLIRFVNALINK